jgi:hypothetical protein
MMADALSESTARRILDWIDRSHNDAQAQLAVLNSILTKLSNLPTGQAPTTVSSNPYIASITVQDITSNIGGDPTTVTVGNAPGATASLQANPNRLAVIMSNVSTVTVYWGLTNKTAVTGQFAGTPLAGLVVPNPIGAQIVIASYTGPIYCIVAAGSQGIVTFQEILNPTPAAQQQGATASAERRKNR